MAVEKTYLKEGEELPPRGNMDKLEPIIDDLKQRADAKASVVTAELRQETSPTVAVIAEPAKPELNATTQDAGAKTPPTLNPDEWRKIEEQRQDTPHRVDVVAEPAKPTADIVTTQNGQEPLSDATRKNISKFSPDIKVGIRKELDTNNDGTFSKEEAEAFAKKEQAFYASLPLEIKEQIIKSLDNPRDGLLTKNNSVAGIKELTGLETTPEAAAIMIDGIRKGASSPNPDPAIAAKEEEEKKEAAKAGKGEKKDLLTMIIDFIMTALGLNKEEEKQKETAVAAQQNTPKEQTTETKEKPQKGLESVDPAALAAAAREGKIQQELGSKIVEASIVQYQAGASKPTAVTTQL